MKKSILPILLGNLIAGTSLLEGDYYANGQTDPTLLGADFAITTLSTIGAGKLVGASVGRDVKSIFSPRFITGAQTARAANTEAVNSGSAASLWASFYSLQAAVNNYKTTNSPSKTQQP